MSESTQIKPSIALLRELKLFARFTDSELESMLQLGDTQTFEAHSNIVIEGELSWGIYLILEGMVGVFKTNKLGGNVYDIGQLKAGNFFGEMSLIDENPRSATVKSITDCKVFHIAKDRFDQFLKRSPDLKLRFYEACVNTLVQRLRVLGDDYVVSQYQLWKTALSKGSEAA